MIDGISKDVFDIDLTIVISEVKLVGSNPKEWWIDIGATRHMCSEKKMFSTFEPTNTRENVHMGNSTTSEIKCQGKVVLKLVFKSNKFVLSKSGMYVGKGYMSHGMWKLNVMTIIKSNMNKASASTYMLELSNIWHSRLGHVNYNTFHRLINLNHIQTFQIDAKHKCETCVEAKLTKSSFQSVERHIEPLDLIHSDICDLKFIQTRGGNKYFITFVDDSTKYCYVYLLKSKGEVIEKFALYKNRVENQLNKKIKVLRSDQGSEYE